MTGGANSSRGSLWLSLGLGGELAPVDDITRIAPCGGRGVTITLADGSGCTLTFESDEVSPDEMSDRLVATIARCRSRGDTGVIGVHDDDDERSPSWVLIPPEGIAEPTDGMRVYPKAHLASEAKQS